MANPQQEMQKSFARVLGYDGPMQGFGNYIQSDPAISEKYRGMLAIAEKQRDMAKQNMMRMSQSPKPQMARGGVVRRMQVGGAVGNPADMEQFPTAELPPLQQAPNPSDIRPMYEAEQPVGQNVPYGENFGSLEQAKALDRQIAGQNIYASPAQLLSSEVGEKMTT